MGDITIDVNGGRLRQVLRGLSRHCPTCGQGKLFRGYLAVEPICPVCGADNGRYPADDAPPYVTILIVGHIIVPLALIVDGVWLAPDWVQMVLWAGLGALLTLVLLPFVKGGVLGVTAAMGIVRDAPAADPLIAEAAPPPRRFGKIYSPASASKARKPSR